METFEGVKEVINAVLQRELEASRTAPVQTTESTTRLDPRIQANLKKKCTLYRGEKKRMGEILGRLRQLATRSTTTTTAASTTVEETTTTELATTTVEVGPIFILNINKYEPFQPSTMRWIEETRPAPTHPTPATVRPHYRHEFYTQTKPPSFRDPNCRDMRYSCGFWLRANGNVCEEQRSFMRAQCAYTCKFCEPTTTTTNA